MAHPSSAYDWCDPASTVLYGIVRDHSQAFRAHVVSLRDGEGPPWFVERDSFMDRRSRSVAAGDVATIVSAHLVSRISDTRHNSRAAHPGCLRCSSLKYGQYSRSSRLAIRARRSATYATYH